MSTDLTTIERSRLRTLEKIVDQGMDTFVRVGNALKELRDSKLYRGTHKTFAAYVEDRWQFKKSYAYQLIDSAVVAENVQHAGQKRIPENARQAVELAKASPEEQAEIWNEVCEEEEKPTARRIREKVSERAAAKQPASEVIDPATDRARAKVPDLCRQLGYHLGTLGAQGKFDQALREMEEFAQ